MSNFWQRTLTGILFIGTIIWSILEGPFLFELIFLPVSLLTLREFYAITTKADSIEPNRTLGILAGAVLYISICAGASVASAAEWQVLIFPFVGIIFFAELYRKKAQPFSNIAISITGVLYAVLPFALLIKIACFSGEYDAGVLMGYFIIIWSSDTFAYLIGRKIGKRRLFERISPKKSWEGSIGGAIATIGVAYLISRWQVQLSLELWIAMALIIIVTGTLGDLTESLLKRSLGIKDSGNILPGHGGFLDRFDAVLLSAPFVWALLSLAA